MLTQISDVVVPEVYLKYTNERITELSEIRQSGILRHDPRIDVLASQGGSTIEMPYWKTIEGETQVLIDDPEFKIKTHKITAGLETAVLLHRGIAWSATDLSAELSGSDPLKAIINQGAHFFVMDDQRILLAKLEGIFNSAGMEYATLDISEEPPAEVLDAAVKARAKAEKEAKIQAEKDAESEKSGKNQSRKTAQQIPKAKVPTKSEVEAPNKMNAYAFINALKALGDSRGQIKAMIMHSHVVSHLEMLNLITTIPDSRGETLISLYQRRRVIEDDGCPVEIIAPGYDKFTTYLFGEGAIALGYGGTRNPVGFKRDELSASGLDVLVHRRSLIMHPNGFRWRGPSNPSNDMLRVGENWERVLKKKNIPILRIISNG